MVCGAKEPEQQHWVNALYRATGQSTRPQKSDTSNGNDVNDIRKAGLDSLISSKPGLVNQVSLQCNTGNYLLYYVILYSK